jgi:hypothetical protein
LTPSRGGWWQLEVALERPLRNTSVAFDVEAAKALPRYLALWQWLSWPAVPIVLFGAHQFLVSRRS